MAKAKIATKKSSSVKSKQPRMRSLRLSPEESPFVIFRLTQQSIYWLVVSLLILALGIWVVTLSVRLQSLYDQVDVNSSQIESSSKTQND